MDNMTANRINPISPSESDRFELTSNYIYYVMTSEFSNFEYGFLSILTWLNWIIVPVISLFMKVSTSKVDANCGFVYQWWAIIQDNATLFWFI